MPMFEAMQLPAAIDAIAPDGSEVRVLCGIAGRCSSAQFLLPPGQTARPVRHRTVDEIWHILRGEGEMWLRDGAREAIVALRPGVTVTLPLGTSFQFRNSGSEPLEIFGVTMPPWPTGTEEAVPAAGPWAPVLPTPDGA